MHIIGVITQTGLLHGLVGPHAFLEEGLVTFRGLDLAFQCTHHERMRRFACAARETFYARFKAPWKLETCGRKAHK